MNALWWPARRALAAIAALGLGLLAGCAALEATPTGPGAPSADARACTRWLAQLDAATDDAGVRDGGAYRVPGFAYLRVDRFLASFRGELAADSDAFGAWAGRLLALDAEARDAELRNLPPQWLPLAGMVDKLAVQAQTRRCAGLLAQSELAWPGARQLLLQRARVPDDYSRWKRAAGLYPLTRLPFFRGVQGWQQAALQQFSAPAAAPLRVYAPAGPPVAAGRLAALQAQRGHDALGIPLLSPADQALLLQAYAPQFEIETAGAHDRFGALYWPRAPGPGIEMDAGSAPAPAVDLAQPLVYQRLAYTRYQGQTLLQLVYSLWFPARPPSRAMDLLSGQLDAVVLRVTLGPGGAPLLVDTIHACGCYHLFVTTPGVTPRPAPQAGMEWAFVPATLPALAPGQRVVVRLASGSHYVVGVQPTHAEGGAATPYALADDNALRTLPVAGGGTRSAFWPSGIVPGTERGERLLFWPMGIDSPGAMRQWGRQPTAFVGRRHFDDADLLELRFRLGAP